MGDRVEWRTGSQLREAKKNAKRAEKAEGLRYGTRKPGHEKKKFMRQEWNSAGKNFTPSAEVPRTWGFPAR